MQSSNPNISLFIDFSHFLWFSIIFCGKSIEFHVTDTLFSHCFLRQDIKSHYFITIPQDSMKVIITIIYWFAKVSCKEVLRKKVGVKNQYLWIFEHQENPQFCTQGPQIVSNKLIAIQIYTYLLQPILDTMGLVPLN